MGIDEKALRQTASEINYYRNQKIEEIPIDILRVFYKELEARVKELEEERQSIINELEEHYRFQTEQVRRFEQMRRNTDDSFYKRSHQTSIHKLNAQRELIKGMLDWYRSGEQ